MSTNEVDDIRRYYLFLTIVDTDIASLPLRVNERQRMIRLEASTAFCILDNLCEVLIHKNGI